MIREWLPRSPAQRVPDAERMLRIAGSVADQELAKRLISQAKSLLTSAARDANDSRQRLVVDNFGDHREWGWGTTMESDISYFRRRCSEERTAALQSRDSETRKSHLELAERYEDLVRAMSTHDINADQSDRFYGVGVTGGSEHQAPHQ